MGKKERRFLSWDRKMRILLLAGSQAVSARPSDKDRMGVKTLGSSKPCHRAGGNFTLINYEIILKLQHFSGLNSKVGTFD
jgi:hypothetical protein